MSVMIGSQVLGGRNGNGDVGREVLKMLCKFKVMLCGLVALKCYWYLNWEHH